MSFAFGWNVFRLAVWLAIAVWVHPRLFDWIGGHDLAIWFKHHRWVHVLGFLPLGLLGLISMLQPVRTRQRTA